MTTTLLRRATSIRYIFLLSGLAFVLWSLAVFMVPTSSTFFTLLQPELDHHRSAIPTATNAASTSSDSTSMFPNDSNTSQLQTRPNLGHAHVYVISLVDRQDRREQMAFLQTSIPMFLPASQDQDPHMLVTWTVVDAVPSNATLVERILHRVVVERAERRANEDASGSASGLGAQSRFRWPEEIDAVSVSSGSLRRSGADVWAEVAPVSWSPRDSGWLEKFEKVKNKNRDKGKGKDRDEDKAIDHLTIHDASRGGRLACATEDDSIPAFADDTWPEWMVLSPAKIACWHSHVLAIRRFVEGQQDALHEVAIILEDDVDMERDISARLARVWAFLPVGWDIVFLGHCWSDEAYYPPLTAFGDTNLHPSHDPKCTHGYVLSVSGARRLLQHLRYPPFAYSRALDQAYAWLVRSGRLRGYSVVPSVVVQRKSGRSDISSGAGSRWKEVLHDGVFGG